MSSTHTTSIKTLNPITGTVRWTVRINGKIAATGVDINPARAARTMAATITTL